MFTSLPPHKKKIIYFKRNKFCLCPSFPLLHIKYVSPFLTKAQFKNKTTKLILLDSLLQEISERMAAQGVSAPALKFPGKRIKRVLAVSTDFRIKAF